MLLPVPEHCFRRRSLALRTQLSHISFSPLLAKGLRLRLRHLPLSGTNAASFDINRATGQLITKALDFEDTNNPSDNEFEVTVTATDPFGVTATSDVTITVTDVNEDPSVMGAASIDHAENGTELDTDAETANVQAATYTATDADVDDVPADLKWTLSGADASKFSITDKGATGTLSFKEAPDYEVPWRLGREQRV